MGIFAGKWLPVLVVTIVALFFFVAYVAKDTPSTSTNSDYYALIFDHEILCGFAELAVERIEIYERSTGIRPDPPIRVQWEQDFEHLCRLRHAK